VHVVYLADMTHVDHRKCMSIDEGAELLLNDLKRTVDPPTTHISFSSLQSSRKTLQIDNNDEFLL